eukprot:gnl/TRDRNA2_/TRDRNA2_141373_c1_seq1.p1 gnl/TRDRNA2_/TRDRNA2_141373_c1~~gnl/TRDRNA2_/TRDRNA2_141373_c1_seq1.p1  ORF type:complete len:108 (-),score=7.30 gnl/TRDRNA2_/TRDRNA2_141373_c1_seq1:229-552(-)
MASTTLNDDLCCTCTIASRRFRNLKPLVGIFRVNWTNVTAASRTSTCVHISGANVQTSVDLASTHKKRSEDAHANSGVQLHKVTSMMQFSRSFGASSSTLDNSRDSG